MKEWVLSILLGIATLVVGLATCLFLVKMVMWGLALNTSASIAVVLGVLLIGWLSFMIHERYFKW